MLKPKREVKLTARRRVSDKSLVEICCDELDFLRELRLAVGTLNNRIHDLVAAVAIAKLQPKHKGVEFRYSNAGASGIDITGRKGGKVVVVAEVKTNVPRTTRLQDPQIKGILKDLERLVARNVASRYLVLLTPEAKTAVQKQLRPGKLYPSVEIICATGQVNREV